MFLYIRRDFSLLGIRYCFGYKENCTFTVTSLLLYRDYLSTIQVRTQHLSNTSLMSISTALQCLDRLDIPSRLKGLLSRRYLVLYL